MRTQARRVSPALPRRLGGVLALALLASLLPPGPARADDAQVLPKGVFRTTLDGNHYLPIREKYDPDGRREAIAADYNRPLDSRLFPLLAPLDPFVGGRASIGDSEVSYKYDFTIVTLGLQYGITDRLTAGVQIPYWWFKNTVKARLSSGPGSSANVGLNPGAGPPVIPLAFGGAPFTTENAQALLGPGLRGIPGFGFKRVESFSRDGLSDIEAGLRYQFVRTSDWRGAVTGGARFPTGRADDPDNLVDYEFGAGAYALLLRLHADFVVSNLWKRPALAAGEPSPAGPAAGDLVLNGTFRYDAVLPDKQDKRVPDDVNNPITVNKEVVSRDLGDRFEFEVSAKYNLLSSLTLSGLYKYGLKLEDRVSGERGFAYSSLEEETAATEHVFIFSVSYSTVPLYLQKRFPVPLVVSLGYRNRFAGSNNALKSQYVTWGLQFFF